MDSCGVGAFSLNYGPWSARGKAHTRRIPAIAPRPHVARHPTVQLPHAWLLAIPVPQGSSVREYRSQPPDHLDLYLRSTRDRRLDTALTRSYRVSSANVEIGIASCNGVRVSPECTAVQDVVAYTRRCVSRAHRRTTYFRAQVLASRNVRAGLLRPAQHPLCARSHPRPNARRPAGSPSGAPYERDGYAGA